MSVHTWCELYNIYFSRRKKLLHIALRGCHISIKAIRGKQAIIKKCKDFLLNPSRNFSFLDFCSINKSSVMCTMSLIPQFQLLIFTGQSFPFNLQQNNFSSPSGLPLAEEWEMELFIKLKLNFAHLSIKNITSLSHATQ